MSDLGQLLEQLDDAVYWFHLAYSHGVSLTLDEQARLAKSPMYSYMYALHVLKGPFVLGEPAISTSGYYSLQYALGILGARFTAGESAIAKDYTCSVQYAKDMLLDPEPETWGVRFFRPKGDYNPWKVLQEVR